MTRSVRETAARRRARLTALCFLSALCASCQKSEDPVPSADLNNPEVYEDPSEGPSGAGETPEPAEGSGDETDQNGEGTPSENEVGQTPDIGLMPGAGGAAGAPNQG